MRLQLIAHLVAAEDAVTAIEYALMGALIAMAIVSTAALVGSKTLGLWQLVSRCVETAIGGAGRCT